MGLSMDGILWSICEVMDGMDGQWMVFYGASLLTLGTTFPTFY